MVKKNIILKLNTFKYENIQYLDTKKNIIMNGNFTKIIYSDNNITLTVDKSYWDLIKKEFKDNPKVKHISQQRNNPVGFRKYNEAVEMYKNGSSLDVCIKLLDIRFNNSV